MKLCITLVLLFFSTTSNGCLLKPKVPTSKFEPKILSSLYGYNDCIGGVNDFDTEEEYIEELKKRNCTVVTGPDGTEITNVAPAAIIRFACNNFGLEWLDGMPVVFNFPLKDSPDRKSFEVTLSDGSKVTPDCVTLNPANEDNEMDTLLILGQFGDGPKNTIRPVQFAVVESLILVAPDGEIEAKGVTFENEGDMNYVDSSVRLAYSRMWSVNDYSEGTHYPNWPLPSSVYPNTCEQLYPSTTHIIRMAFSGGITFDGVSSVLPSSSGIFSVFSAPTLESVPYLGLADLGKAESASTGEAYQSDGDNYLDICLDLKDNPYVVEEDIVIKLHCDVSTGSVLYPPKGRPYGCKEEEILLIDSELGYFTKYWTST